MVLGLRRTERTLIMWPDETGVVVRWPEPLISHHSWALRNHIVHVWSSSGQLITPSILRLPNHIRSHSGDSISRSLSLSVDGDSFNVSWNTQRYIKPPSYMVFVLHQDWVSKQFRPSKLTPGLVLFRHVVKGQIKKNNTFPMFSCLSVVC